MAATPKPVRKMKKEHDSSVRSKTKELKEMEGGHIKSMRKHVKKAEKMRHSKEALQESFGHMMKHAK